MNKSCCKRGWRSACSVLLVLMFVISMLSGSFVLAAEDGTEYERASALEQGSNYLIVTEYEGTRYALSYDGSVLGSQAVALTENGTIVVDGLSAVWTPGEDSTLESWIPGNLYFLRQRRLYGLHRRPNLCV